MTFELIARLLPATALALALGAAPVGLPAAAQTDDGHGHAAEEAEEAGEHVDEEDGEEEIDAAPREISAASVLATVGERQITLGEVISLRRDLPQQYQGLPDEILSQGLLDQLIDQTLMEEAARKANVDGRLDVALSIRNQIRAVMAEAWMRAELTSRLDEPRLRAEYDARYAEAEPEQEIRAAHILVDSEEKAAELLAEIAGGADFAALAAEHGTDGTASRGGDLGWFVKADMVPQFAEAAFAIEPGTVGGPVQTPFGWHVIRVEERRDQPVPPFEEVRDELIAEVAQALQAEIMAELRAATPIVVTEPPVPAAAIRADDLLLPPEETAEGGSN